MLLDHNVDRRLRRHLPGHDVRTTRQMGWDTLVNGALLRAAAADHFGVLLTNDKDIEHQQNLAELPLPIILLDLPRNAIRFAIPVMPVVLGLLGSPMVPAMYIVAPDGSVEQVTAPRPKP